VDEELGERVALRIEGQDVARVFLHAEHVVEGNAAGRIGLEELDEEFVLLGFLAVVFDGGARAFVGPAGERAAKVRSKNRVCHFVGQDTVEDSFARALNLHRPLAGLVVVEDEARRSARAEAGGDVGPNGAGSGPGRQLMAKPFRGQIAAIRFRGPADFFGELR
jgi:hypothetical protein